MKVHKYGTVILTEGRPVRIEDWNVEREPSDPKDFTTEQLLLGFAVQWARKRLDAAVTHDVMAELKKKFLALPKAGSVN